MKIVLAIVILLLVEYYCFVAIRLSFPRFFLQNKLWFILSYAVLCITFYFVLMQYRGWDTQAWSPMVRNVLIASLMGIAVAKIIVSVFLLIGDIYQGMQWLWHKVFSAKAEDNSLMAVKPDKLMVISRSTFLARASLIVGALVFSTFNWGIGNRYRYITKRLKIKIDNLPEGLQGLKILHISDIHMGSFDDEAAVKEGVERILAEKADVILFTGDLVNNKASEVEPYLDLFKTLNAPLGVYSVLGNHDYGDYVNWDTPEVKQKNLDTLIQHHSDLGWKILMNEHVVLNKNGVDFPVIGVENWSQNFRFPRKGDLKKAYEGVSEKDYPFQMLLTHDPSHWDAQVNNEYKDIDLTLSGHTHGMQFGIDIPWLKWSPSQYVYKQWAGLYQKGKQYINVNVGFGFLGYPGRIGILPEITVIELETT